MVARLPGDTDFLLFTGLGVVFALWLGLSSVVIVDRLLYDRRTRRLREIARGLADLSATSGTSVAPSSGVDEILSRLSRQTVYRLVVDVTLPVRVTELCAAFAVERWGLTRMVRDASPRRGRRKWRRISALFVLGQIRAAGIHDLLERAMFDGDPDVAGAAVVVLHRLRDRRAAEILISALREQSYAPSRIATQLEQFAIPIGDLLRPLLADSRPHARYWAVSLLSRSSDGADFASEIAALSNDAHAPVRKLVVEALARFGDFAAAPIALHLIGDSVAFVRSTAIRSFARFSIADANAGARRAAAAKITPFLADVAWDVRLAAKQSLVGLGPAVWPEVALGLDSSDRFARNGSAEVLQDLGLLDRVIDEIGRGIEPATEVVSVLERAFREGGSGMIDAAVARSNRELFPSIDALLTRLRFVGVRMLT